MHYEHNDIRKDKRKYLRLKIITNR